jgi:Ser/Thr protein kinase RdoA (MazF antagonist)
MQRPSFASREEYARYFTDTNYWRPYIEEICERHDIEPITRIQAGKAGSNPVFIVNDRFVVKLYTYLFGGADSIMKERELYGLFAQAPQLPVPKLITQGSLYPLYQEDWHWPYIITTVIPGITYGEVRELVSFEDRLALATYIGSFLHAFHHLPLERSVYFKRSWEPFANFLEEQRILCIANQTQWKALPQHLIDQIDDYLLSISTLIDQDSEPLLLDCDLFEDHVLGFHDKGRWHTTGIIDFGDARVGNWLYEIPVLHIGLFHGDKRLLRAFLTGYGVGIAKVHQEQLVRKAMSFTLLHEYDLFIQVFRDYPEAAKVETLDGLAALLWDIDKPGLR